MGRIPKSGFAGVFRESQTIDVNQGTREAQQISKIAGSVANTAQKVEHNQQQRQEKLDQAADQNYIATREILFKKANAELARGFKEQYKDDPSNPELRAQFEERSEKLQTAFVGGLKRQDSKDAMTRMMSNQRFSQLESIEKFKAQQLQENILNDNLTAIDTIKDISIDDASLSSALDSLKQVDTLKISNTTSLGGKNATRMHLQQQKDVAGAYIDSNLANQNIGQVKELLKNDRFKQALGPGGIKSARDKIRAYEKAQEQRSLKINKMKKDNPWKFLKATGETKDLVLLDFKDASTFIKRQQYMSEMEQKHDLDMSDIPASPEEVEGLKAFVLDSTAKNVQETLEKIDMGIDDEFLKDFGAQIFPKEPELGGALGLFDEDPDTAGKMFAGFKRRASGTLEISNSNLDTVIDDKLKNVIDNDTTRGLLKRSIGAVAIENVYSKGESLKDDVSDSSEVQDAVDSVLGPIMKSSKLSFLGIGPQFKTDNSGILSFRGVNGEFLNEDEFTDVFSELTPENMKQNLTRYPVANGKVVDVAQFSDRFTLRTVGDGNYQLTLDDGSILFDQVNKPFILNLKEFYTNTLEEPK